MVFTLALSRRLITSLKNEVKMELIIDLMSHCDDVLRLHDGGRSPSCLSRRACASSSPSWTLTLTGPDSLWMLTC